MPHCQYRNPDRNNIQFLNSSGLGCVIWRKRKKSLASLCQKNSIYLPDTSIVQTGTNGFHLYFKNSQRIIVRGGKNLAPGVDVRAEGAHVVAPPSIHKNGNQYYWLHGGIDEISPADENLYKLLNILCNH